MNPPPPRFHGAEPGSATTNICGVGESPTGRLSPLSPSTGSTPPGHPQGFVFCAACEKRDKPPMQEAGGPATFWGGRSHLEQGAVPGLGSDLPLPREPQPELMEKLFQAGRWK